MVDLIIKWLALRTPKGERGQDLVEYALLGGVVALLLISVTVTGLTAGLVEFFGEMGQCIDFDASTNCGS
jgi:Flp pilus assembly pilin Flp